MLHKVPIFRSNPFKYPSKDLAQTLDTLEVEHMLKEMIIAEEEAKKEFRLIGSVDLHSLQLEDGKEILINPSVILQLDPIAQPQEIILNMY